MYRHFNFFKVQPLKHQHIHKKASVTMFINSCLFIYLFIVTNLYRADIISSQASFHMYPVLIFLYEDKDLII